MAGVGAYLIWGSSPLYWNAIDHVPPAEALSWRVAWAIVILLVVLAIRGDWSDLRRALATSKTVRPVWPRSGLTCWPGGPGTTQRCMRSCL